MKTPVEISGSFVSERLASIQNPLRDWVQRTWFQNPLHSSGQIPLFLSKIETDSIQHLALVSQKIANTMEKISSKSKRSYMLSRKINSDVLIAWFWIKCSQQSIETKKTKAKKKTPNKAKLRKFCSGEGCGLGFFPEWLTNHFFLIHTRYSCKPSKFF